MPVTAKSRRGHQTSFRWHFPERTLHIVDIENLAGAAVPSLALVSETQGRYLKQLVLGMDDQVVMAASHLALLDAACGWPNARYRVRSGKDGADLELIDVLEHENIAARFSHVVIGSGDGIFGRPAAPLAAGGGRVTVVSRPGRRNPPRARAPARGSHGGIGAGAGSLGRPAARRAAGGVRVTVVSRPGSLNASLARAAAGNVIYLA